MLRVSLILSPMPLVAGWGGITYFGWGLIWCWVVITAWIWALGLTFFARFLHGRWRTMRVIEPEIEAEEPLPDYALDPVSGKVTA